MDVNSLINSSGLTADQMTHALKILGNGDMQKGIKYVGDTMAKAAANIVKKDEFNKGLLTGGGGAIAAFGAIVAIYWYMKEQRDSKSEKNNIDKSEKQIFDAIEQSKIDCKTKKYCMNCGYELNDKLVCPECGFTLSKDSVD